MSRSIRLAAATIAAVLLLAAPAVAETIVKSNVILPTVAARDAWISDAQAVIAGRQLKPGVQAFVGTGEEIGPTVARMKFTLVSDAQALTVSNAIISAGNSRGVLPTSFVRSTRDDGSVIREFYW